jgi:hypothetical protein
MIYQSVASGNQKMSHPHETGRERNDANDDKIVGQATAGKKERARETTETTETRKRVDVTEIQMLDTDISHLHGVTTSTYLLCYPLGVHIFPDFFLFVCLFCLFFFFWYVS